MIAVGACGVSGVGVAVIGHVCSLGNHRGRHGEPGRVVVLVPGLQSPEGLHQNNHKYSGKADVKKDLEQAECVKEVHAGHSIEHRASPFCFYHTIFAS